MPGTARYGVGPPGPCLLFGFTAPFATDVCKRLYGDHATYVERVTKRTEELVASRLLLDKGAERLVAAARADATFS